MNFNLNRMDMDPSVGILFVGLMGLWGIAVTIYWMVVAWRAMRAHERIAASLERLPRP